MVSWLEHVLGVLVLLGSGSGSVANEDERPYLASPLTRPGEFTNGIEGPGCDGVGNVYAVNFAREGTIGKVDPETGRGEVFVTLPGKSVGNGIVFDRQGRMYVADYVGHNVLRIDLKTRKIAVFAHAAMNQPNDLAIAPDGTIYASDPDWANSKGQVWKVEHCGRDHARRRRHGHDQRHRGQPRRQVAVRQRVGPAQRLEVPHPVPTARSARSSSSASSPTTASTACAATSTATCTSPATARGRW